MKLEILRFRNQKIDTHALIEDLISISMKLNKTPTIAEYNANGLYESSVYIRRFGSWNKALEAAGFAPNNKQWSEKDLLNNLVSVWTLLCRQPTRRDMDNKKISKISSGSYLRFYGTWTNALNSCVINANNIDIINIESVPKKSTHKTNREINLRLRFLIMKRDNFKCCICGRSPATTPSLELQIDHITPWSKGGETIIENLQTLCTDCNLGKSNLDN